MTTRNPGMQSAAAHAESDYPGWVDLAVERLRSYARRAKKPFTIEQARQKLTSLPAPAELRAWGSVTRKAASLGIIRRVGFRPAESSHGSAKPAYSRGPAA